nr:MAG TPA: hypothetical protein [Caudoviricetes sp.]
MPPAASARQCHQRSSFFAALKFKKFVIVSSSIFFK